nr:MAG TPA: peptidase [Caudoviricetes sp.]
MNANEKINKYYDEYKNFMKISDMPLIVPVERKEAGDYNALAYLDRDFIKGNAIPIMYMDFLFDYNESFIRSIFFHEFTHIYDANKSFENLDESEINIAIDSFSEYHASQIEMASQLGMKNKNDIFALSRKFKTGCKMMCKEESMDIQNYILCSLADITNVLMSPQYSFSNKPNYLFEKEYSDIERRIFYYYGKYDLYNKYSGKNMPDLLISNCPEFSKEINNIHDVLKSKDFVNNIDSMKAAIDDFQKLYFEYFK